MALPKQYTPAEHETVIYEQWEAADAFAPSEAARASGKPPYVIMLPPPNITGSLHMGHALQDTIMDILTRYHRMLGEPTLWVPGMDHAALPTNKILEDQLHAEGSSKQKIGREAFLERAQTWYDTVGQQIVRQMKRLGCSCDWRHERFTMDERYVAAVTEAFLEYAQRGYIYRGTRMVNWDPATQTTVSDLEVEYREEQAPYYYFQYGPFVISTARPETKFGEQYVVMHPADERYTQYQHGQTIEVEWITGPVTATIIKDEASDPAVGTGVMTITPGHSAVDFEIAQRHDLAIEQIIDLHGTLLPIAGDMSGRSLAEARAQVVEQLTAKGLLVKVDETYVHNVAVNDRGKGVIEPQVMRQWFVDMSTLKQTAIEVVRDDLITFYPPRWKEHFLTWLDNVRDWNINRQIWLGHRLPVWWKPGTRGTAQEEGNYVVSATKPAGEWEQDPDVLDTWFSSALWPFATLGWPEATADLATYYPTSVLTTAREILYLWVARMVFSGLHLLEGDAYGSRAVADRIPFRQVFIHPVVLAHDGRRMSKSLGTGVDPLELIEQYGADATRFGLMYQMGYDAQALTFDEAAIAAARNFANKLWNMARLLESLPESTGEVSLADRWIEQRLAAVQQAVAQAVETFRFGDAAHLLYDFVWHDMADWYLEVVKVTGSAEHARQVFRQTLVLLHPFMPYVTEVLWRELGGAGLLITQPWPATSAVVPDAAVAQQFQSFQAIVTAVRSARRLLELPAGERLQLWVEQPVLPVALAALARVELVLAAGPGMKRLPLSTGEAIAVGSIALTPARLTHAAQRLAAQRAELEATLQQHQQTLQVMRAKAPAEKVAVKEATVAHLAQQLDELAASERLLGAA